MSPAQAFASASAVLAERLEPLLERAGGSSVVSATVEVDGALDPARVAFASRLAGERWFAWEPPGDSFALAGIGSAVEIVGRGGRRFAELAADAARVDAAAIGEGPAGLPSGAGPVWVGGFAFAPDGGSEPHWSTFPPALLWRPELALCRSGGRVFLTAAVRAAGAEGPRAPRASLERLRRRIAALEDRPLPLIDPEPRTATRVVGAREPSRYEQVVAAAVARIRAGEMRKVVLAREVRVEAPAAHDVAALFGALEGGFERCFRFCVGTAEGAFVGASPELLIRRVGASATTLALAGSTRRSADPAVDDHLGERLLASAKDRSEHAIVVERIRDGLRPLSVWVEAEREPQLAKIANIQHLATPLAAQLTEPLPAIELAARLHPTPAVGGEPPESALAAIDELEGLDRGWYSGGVGWMDATGDGELCVALRSALLRDRTAHLYAGAGIVADSEPAAELAETELKLDALLPLLAS